MAESQIVETKCDVCFKSFFKSFLFHLSQMEIDVVVLQKLYHGTFMGPKSWHQAESIKKKKKKSAHVVFKNNSSTGGEAPSAFIPQM